MTSDITDLTERIQERDGVAVVLYSKGECFGCRKTKEKLDEHHILYTEVDVEKDKTAFKYVTEVLGYRQMPVIVASTESGYIVWSGLQPVKIAKHITHRDAAA